MSLFTRDRHDTDHRDEEPDDVERTVRIARKRFVRRQWARRWLAWRRVVVALVLLGLVVVSVWLVFASPLLAVSGVKVEGTSALAPSVVRRAAAVPTGTPLATVDLDAIGRRVKRLPAVRSVDVSRSWPDAVRIDVVEREAVAVVARGRTLRGLDASGVLFRRYSSRPAGLPLIRMTGRARPDALAEAARVAGSLPSAISGRVASVEVRTVDTISLQLRNGRVVRWGSAADSDAKGRVLAVLLDQKASFYDVSVPGQPIIKK